MLRSFFCHCRIHRLPVKPLIDNEKAISGD